MNDLTDRQMATAEQRCSTYTADQLPNDEYHNPENLVIGASMLEDFRKSRRLFEAKYITHTIPQQESRAMRLGTFIHTRVLEPDKWMGMLPMESKPEQPAEPERPAKGPDGEPFNLRKKSHREWWAPTKEAYEAATEKWRRDVDAWREKYSDSPDSDEIQQVEAVAAAVFNNPYANRILSLDGKPEFTIMWTDEETGLRCKCRVDWFCKYPTDLKTTRSASPAAFASQYASLGYHRKRAHYSAGLFAYTGEKLPFIHIAACTNPPYEVGVYEAKDDMPVTGQSLGREQWRATMREVAECFERHLQGDPYAFANPWEQGISALYLPKWAFYEDDYKFGEGE